MTTWQTVEQTVTWTSTAGTTWQVVRGSTGGGGGGGESLWEADGGVVVPKDGKGVSTPGLLLPTHTAPSGQERPLIVDDEGAVAVGAVNSPNGIARLDGDGTLPDVLGPSTWARDSEVSAAVSAHAGATDPHGDRAYSVQRANHTGTQAQSTVTDLVTDLAAKAPLASPTFTGTPTAPTPSAGDSSTKLATTAFVDTAVVGIDFAPSLSGTVWLGTPGITWTVINDALPLTANRIHYLPFVVTKAIAVDRIGVEVTTGVASSNIRFGVYACGRGIAPTGAPLIDATQSSASTGAKLTSVSATLPPGRYTACVVSDGAVFVRSGQNFNVGGSWLNPSLFGAGSAIIAGSFYASLTYPTTALPTSGPAPTATHTVGSSLPSSAPLIAMRWT